MEKLSYVVNRIGSLKNLTFTKDTIRPPEAHEVMVSVKAIGLNYADIFAIIGLYSATPKTPFVPGLEYAGEVVAVGENVANVRSGDKVMGVTRFGGYTSVLNIDARYVIPLPEDWTFEEGAAFPV